MDYACPKCLSKLSLRRIGIQDIYLCLECGYKIRPDYLNHYCVCCGRKFIPTKENYKKCHNRFCASCYVKIQGETQEENLKGMNKPQRGHYPQKGTEEIMQEWIESEKEAEKEEDWEAQIKNEEERELEAEMEEAAMWEEDMWHICNLDNSQDSEIEDFDEDGVYIGTDSGIFDLLDIEKIKGHGDSTGVYKLKGL